MISTQRHERTKDNRARLPTPAIRNIAYPDRRQRRLVPARAAAGETPLCQSRGRWGMPVPEPQGRTHALAKAGPKETHPAQTRRRKSGSACYSGRHKVAPRTTLDRSTLAPSAKLFRHGPFIFKIIFTRYFLAPLAKTPNRSFCLCFSNKTHFPKKCPTKIILALEVP